jgi:hypothetical protein
MKCKSAESFDGRMIAAAAADQPFFTPQFITRLFLILFKGGL